ncbi:hypothetical protein ACIRH0_03825 [Streptomyces sp. NPDC093675]|uniref:hypothetical protein n=1 Tax=unclassified Streptomyces TaxID=2593676 RepID=UPI0034295DD3
MYPDYDAPRLTGPYLDVHAERQRQIARLGVESHDPAEWVLSLVETVGNLAEAVLAATRAPDQPTSHLGPVREEALQLAAGGIALLEHLDRLESADT